VIEKKQKATKKENLIKYKKNILQKFKKNLFFEKGKYVFKSPIYKNKNDIWSETLVLKNPQGGQMIMQ